MTEGYKQVNTYVTVTMYDDMYSLAKRHGLSMSDVLRKSIDMVLQHPDKIDFEMIRKNKEGIRKKIR